MEIKVDVYLKGLKKYIYRQIIANDNITLREFCEYTIISMNGTGKHLYQLIVNDKYTYLSVGCDIYDEENECMMEDIKLCDLQLKEKDKLLLNYDFSADWDIIIKVKNVKKTTSKKNFQVISGYGQGIFEELGYNGILKPIITSKLNELDKKTLPNVYDGFNEYINKKFDVFTANAEIQNYKEKYRELVKPKNYIMNITLEDFEKEIKRKIAVDSNVKLNIFCTSVIRAMRGDLSHPYGLQIGKELIDSAFLESKDLNFLELKEKQKFKIIYDWGDNWVFKIYVSKINEGYGYNKRFELLSGKGYGIIDDCGGTYRLQDVFTGENNDWGTYDINDFDLNNIQRIIDIYF